MNSPSADSSSASWDAIYASFRENRLAHAYVVTGGMGEDTLSFINRFLQLLLCESGEPPCGSCPSCGRVSGRNHPDVFWIEPQSKSRRILVEDMRAMIRCLNQTSYEHGWKTAVILHADRLGEGAANAFLKTLEEPPPRTLILLVTGSPQSLLPTIRSRCQIINLSRFVAPVETVWRATLMDLLRSGFPSNAIDAALHADMVVGILKTVKKGLQDEISEEAGEDLDEKVLEARVAARYREERARILEMMMLWQRDVLLLNLGISDPVLSFPDEREAAGEQAARLTYRRALRNVQQVEEIAARLERNLPEAPVFDQGFAA